MGNSVGAGLRCVVALSITATRSSTRLRSCFFCRLARVMSMRPSEGRVFRLRDPEATNGGGDELDTGETSPRLGEINLVYMLRGLVGLAGRSFVVASARFP